MLGISMHATWKDIRPESKLTVRLDTLARDQILSIVPNLHLDCPLFRIRRCLKRFHGVRETEPMRDKGLEIDESSSNQADGFGILICVSILELQIDLICGTVANGKLCLSAVRWVLTHTFCSEGPAPMTKTLPPKPTACVNFSTLPPP